MKPALKQTVLALGILLLFTVIRPSSSHADCPPLPPAACGVLEKLFQNDTTGPWYNQTPSQFADKVLKAPENEIFGERYTYAQINWIFNSIAVMLNPGLSVRTTTDFLNYLQLIKTTLDKLGQDPSSATLKDYASLGPAGIFAAGMYSIYSHPPASGIDSTVNLASNLQIIPSAYAQGYGYSGLRDGGAVRELWKATRNMAYFAIIILLIAAGFLIMFRIKINPQTVVTLQVMIPKLIITLLLVTFSFAIAGFVIDMIYVVIAAIVGFLNLNQIIVGGPYEVSEVIKWLTSGSFGWYIWLQLWGPIMLIIMAVVVGGLIGGILTIPAGGAGAVPGALIGALIGILLSLITLWVLFKIFIMLIKSYVMLILYIIIGPLFIMLDLIPGQQGFGPWFRNIIAHASVFVVVPVMLIIQHVMSWSFIANNALRLQDFNSLGNLELKLPFVGSSLDWWGFFLRMIIGFVIFTMTPKVAEIIRDMLKIPPFKYGTAITEALQPARFAPALMETKRYQDWAATSPVGKRVAPVAESVREFGRGQKWWS